MRLRSRARSFPQPFLRPSGRATRPFAGLRGPAARNRRIAAAISTGTTGFLFQHFGAHISFLPLAVVGAAATGLVWVFLSETKPEKYED